MPSTSALLDVLDCMSFVRSNLRGEARKRFNNDVRALLERRFGRRGFVLPLETKLFILEKQHEGQGTPGGRHPTKNPHHHTIFT